MEQPLDFSKTNKLKSSPSMSNAKRPSINNSRKMYQFQNSENSDETQSRSSTSSPDSLQNNQNSLNFNNTSLSQQALSMFDVVSNSNLDKINFQFQSQSNSLANFRDQSDHHENVISKKKPIAKRSRRSKSEQVHKFATSSNQLELSNSSNTSQNLHTSERENEIKPNIYSPKTKSLQISIDSNMNGEEKSIYGDLFSQDEISPKSQRRRGNPIPESLKDDSYWIRRRKNNDAAKKSRDAKRSKDLITAKRAVLLESENNQLKSQLDQIRKENLILRTFFDEEFCEEKQQIDELISASEQMDSNNIW